MALIDKCWVTSLQVEDFFTSAKKYWKGVKEVLPLESNFGFLIALFESKENGDNAHKWKN